MGMNWILLTIARRIGFFMGTVLNKFHFEMKQKSNIHGGGGRVIETLVFYRIYWKFAAIKMC